MKSSSIVSSDRKLANVVGAKSARACDNCVRKRARWYCAADDAFLCQSCDSSVHSANPLAQRHERVRLKTTSLNLKTKLITRKTITVPSWQKGFTKKARTPRQKKHVKPEFDHGPKLNHPLHLVPEISGEEQSHEENEEQLLYRVPIFDQFVADLCTSANPSEAINNTQMQSFGHESKAGSNDFSKEMNHLQNFLPTEMDLADFAVDVESLLGKGLDDESFDMESLGLLDSKECSFGTGRMKYEDEEETTDQVVKYNHSNEFESIDLGRETFELNFDYDCEEEEDDDVKAHIGEPTRMMTNNSGSCPKVDGSKRNVLLRLNYEGVLSAWDGQKSPWTTGERPDLDDSGGCWPACMNACGKVHSYGDMRFISGHATAMTGGEREARVSRYREKRRTRLFSKKIRYEVRKLNAEKRPRMKGRFVKRANMVAPGLPMLKK